MQWDAVHQHPMDADKSDQVRFFKLLELFLITWESDHLYICDVFMLFSFVGFFSGTFAVSPPGMRATLDGL